MERYKKAWANDCKYTSPTFIDSRGRKEKREIEDVWFGGNQNQAKKREGREEQKG